MIQSNAPAVEFDCTNGQRVTARFEAISGVGIVAGDYGMVYTQQHGWRTTPLTAETVRAEWLEWLTPLPAALELRLPGEPETQPGNAEHAYDAQHYVIPPMYPELNQVGVYTPRPPWGSAYSPTTHKVFVCHDLSVEKPHWDEIELVDAPPYERLAGIEPDPYMPNTFWVKGESVHKLESDLFEVSAGKLSLLDHFVPSAEFMERLRHYTAECERRYEHGTRAGGAVNLTEL